MVTSKEMSEQFRRDLKSLNYYRAKLDDVNCELESLNVKLQGVSSPGIKDVIIENKDPYKNRILELIYQEEEKRKERDLLKYNIQQIEAKLNSLPKKIRKVCIELYVKGKNSENVAFDNGYEYTAVMYRDINRYIKKLG